jgi:hypothetical protein
LCTGIGEGEGEVGGDGDDEVGSEREDKVGVEGETVKVDTAATYVRIGVTLQVNVYVSASLMFTTHTAGPAVAVAPY